MCSILKLKDQIKTRFGKEKKKKQFSLTKWFKVRWKEGFFGVYPPLLSPIIGVSLWVFFFFSSSSYKSSSSGE